MANDTKEGGTAEAADKPDLHAQGEALRAYVTGVAWRGLKEIVGGRADLARQFKRGGYQLGVKNRGRAETLLLKALVQESFRGDLARYLVTRLCPQPPSSEVAAKLMWALTDGLGIPEAQEDGILEATEFSQLSEVVGGPELRVLVELCSAAFSPEQRTQAVASHGTDPQGVTEEERRPEQAKSPEQHTLEFAAERRELRKQARELRAELKKKDVRILQLERKSASQEERATEQAAREEELRTRLDSQLAMHEKQLDGESKKRTQAEQQVTDLQRSLRTEQASTKRLANEVGQLQAELQEFEGCSLLDLLHSEGVISDDVVKCLNEPDDVRELLESVVRPPQTDEDLRGPMSDLGKYWDRLVTQEQALIRSVASLRPVDLVSSVYLQEWRDGTMDDSFTDAKVSLRARAALANLLYEILRRHFERVEGLENGVRGRREAYFGRTNTFT